MICATCRVHEEEIDGATVLHIPESNPVLFGPVGAAVWTDTHVTFTHTVRQDASCLQSRDFYADHDRKTTRFRAMESGICGTG
jgi:hypothetical protein